MWDALGKALRDKHRLPDHYHVGAVGLELTRLTADADCVASEARDMHEGELGFCEEVVSETIAGHQELMSPPVGFVFVLMRAAEQETVLLLEPEAEVKKVQD